MTFAKFGSEFARECARDRLSSEAFRLHVEVHLYLAEVEEASLRVPKHMLRRLAGSDDWQDAPGELVKRGYWKDLGDDYAVVHHAGVARSGLAAQRAKRERDAKALRKRRAKRQNVSGGVSADISDYLTD